MKEENPVTQFCFATEITVLGLILCNFDEPQQEGKGVSASANKP